MDYKITTTTTLLEALGALLPETSSSRLRSWIKQGRVYLNGKELKIPAAKVVAGQTISLRSKERILEHGVKILFEDDHLTAIYKPCHLLSVSTSFETQRTAHAVLKRHYHPKRIYVIHRLDQDTSGVMLFATSYKGFEEMKKIFKVHKITRTYDAIVEGHLDEDQGTWQSYLAEDENYVVRQTDDPVQGELAITHFKVLGKSKNYSWLSLDLETGKKNQIRVHCQQAKIPIAGDKKYGAATNPIKRVCLHASELSFIHPVTKKPLHFECPPPQGFHRLVAK